jgi:hypothetical protein
VYGPRYRDDGRYLLGIIERLTGENQGLRLAAIQDEGLWSSQDAGLRAEVERLTAERDELAADAALGALVRRMPEMLKCEYPDEYEDREFPPQWVGLLMDEAIGWFAQAGAEDLVLWADEGHKTPELAIEHALSAAETKEATDGK